MARGVTYLAVLVLVGLSSCASGRILAEVGIHQSQQVARPQTRATDGPHRRLLLSDSVYFEFSTDSRISLLHTSADMVEGYIDVNVPASIPAGSQAVAGGSAESDGAEGTDGTLWFQVVNEGQPTACTLSVYFHNPYHRSDAYSCSVGSGPDCDKVLCNVSTSGDDHTVLLTSVWHS